MISIKSQHLVVCFLLSSILACGQKPSMNIQALDYKAANLHEQLEQLGKSIGDSRIVLLGENGHGVSEFTESKVELVKWLHEKKGFDVIAFESGFFECGHVWKNIESMTSREALYKSLSYPFQHGELLPLFDYIKSNASKDHPLILSGMDIQAQGYDSSPRTQYIKSLSNQIDQQLIDELIPIDRKLYMVPDFGGLARNQLFKYAALHKDSVSKMYEQASNSVDGWDKWMFKSSKALVDRLSIRGDAELNNTDMSPRFSEIRDEWMANITSALADSIGNPKKVVVWLHNDHGRYGSKAPDKDTNKYAGWYLREMYGQDVYSVGLFMGKGQITDNGRNLRDIVPENIGTLEKFMALDNSPASYLVLRDNTESLVRNWADVSQSYARMGLFPMELVPSEEFDAILYIDRVKPPNYKF